MHSTPWETSSGPYIWSGQTGELGLGLLVVARSPVLELGTRLGSSGWFGGSCVGFSQSTPYVLILRKPENAHAATKLKLWKMHLHTWYISPNIYWLIWSVIYKERSGESWTSWRVEFRIVYPSRLTKSLWLIVEAMRISHQRRQIKSIQTGQTGDADTPKGNPDISNMPRFPNI